MIYNQPNSDEQFMVIPNNLIYLGCKTSKKLM